ncbi:MAG: metal ABC transporter substrate-binding protein [Fimbriimonas sp.]
MKRALLTTAFAAVAAASFGAVKIVTTTPDLASIASLIGGDNVSVYSIIQGARDPHRIEAKPSFMSRTSSADLFLAIGLEMEIGYESAILEGSRNSKVAVGAPGHVYVSDWAYILDKPKGAVTRAMGDVHPYGNPHIWLDPSNGRYIAVKLADKLGNMDPKNAKEYDANLDRFLNRLDTGMFGKELVGKFGGSKLWEWERNGIIDQKLKENNARGDLGGWAAKMAPFAGKPVITYHRSLNYLANRFGLKIVDELEPKPGLDPTPGHLAEVIKNGTASGVKAIIQESFYPTKHAQLVAGKIGAKVIVIPQNVGHDEAAKDYISLFDVIVDRISDGMR